MLRTSILSHVTTKRKFDIVIDVPSATMPANKNKNKNTLIALLSRCWVVTSESLLAHRQSALQLCHLTLCRVRCTKDNRQLTSDKYKQSNFAELASVSK